MATTKLAGNWSVATNWVGDTLPANKETIAMNHDMVYDFDNSAMPNGYGAITIAAGKTLAASTVAGTYILKMAGSIQNSGTIRAGNSAVDRYPTNCLFRIHFNGNNYTIQNQASHIGKVYFYCYDPPVRYLKLISATPKVISGITRANPCVVTCVGHGKSVNDGVYFVGLNGMPELECLRVKVSSVLNADQFTIKWYDTGVDVDSTELSVYVSGGWICPELAEAVGQTQLEVDQDVHLDPEWTRTGALVYLWTPSAGTSEEATISSVSAGYLTISAGLTYNKNSATLAVLETRNVQVITNYTSIYTVVNYGTDHVLDAYFRRAGSANSMSLFAYMSNYSFGGSVYNGEYLCGGSPAISGTISGVFISQRSFNGNHNLYFSDKFLAIAPAYATFAGGAEVNGLICGSSYLFQSLSANILLNRVEFRNCGSAINNYNRQGNIATTADTVFKYCSSLNCHNFLFRGRMIATAPSGQGISQSSGKFVEARFMGCVCGVSSSSVELINCKFYGNVLDVSNSTGAAYNTLFGSNAEFYKYNPYEMGVSDIFQSFDHDQQAGAFRAWTRGGITSSTLTNPPPSQIRSYNHVCESATYPCWRRWKITVEAGRTLRLRMWLKADVAVTVKGQIVLPTADPLVSSSYSPVWEQTGTSDGAWHEYITSWQNTATYPVEVEVRSLAYAASGNAYSQIQYAFDRSPWRGWV